jgi:hypothetical protein
MASGWIGFWIMVGIIVAMEELLNYLRKKDKEKAARHDELMSSFKAAAKALDAPEQSAKKKAKR